jgi:hypothetical protein
MIMLELTENNKTTSQWTLDGLNESQLEYLVQAICNTLAMLDDE